MKQIISMLAIFLLAIGITSASTTVDTTWDGSGEVLIDVISGDDQTTHFGTGGSYIVGAFHLTDSNSNPYGYGVDTISNWKSARVYDGGYISSWTSRDDSKTSYSNPGQYTETFMTTTDGTLEFGWYEGMNYAGMSNCQYGSSKPKTTTGKNFEADGSNYYMYHILTDADGDGAYFEGQGSGSAIVKLQGEKAGNGFNMGSLPICGDSCAWNNNYATYSGTGSGDFEVHAWADNGLTIGCPTCGNGFTIPGDGNDNSATYDLHIGYSGTWSNSNFGVAGN